MLDWRERKPYWRHTKWQMFATLAPFVLGAKVRRLSAVLFLLDLPRHGIKCDADFRFFPSDPLLPRLQTALAHDQIVHVAPRGVQEAPFHRRSATGLVLVRMRAEI